MLPQVTGAAGETAFSMACLWLPSPQLPLSGSQVCLKGAKYTTEAQQSPCKGRKGFMASLALHRAPLGHRQACPTPSSEGARDLTMVIQGELGPEPRCPEGAMYRAVPCQCWHSHEARWQGSAVPWP